MQLQATASALNRGRGRPSLGPTAKTQPIIRPQSMIFKQQPAGQVLVPANYQLSGNQVFQVGFLGPCYFITVRLVSRPKQHSSNAQQLVNSALLTPWTVLGGGRQWVGRATGRSARHGLRSIRRPGPWLLTGNGCFYLTFSRVPQCFTFTFTSRKMQGLKISWYLYKYHITWYILDIQGNSNSTLTIGISETIRDTRKFKLGQSCAI